MKVLDALDFMDCPVDLEKLDELHTMLPAWKFDGSPEDGIASPYTKPWNY